MEYSPLPFPPYWCSNTPLAILPQKKKKQTQDDIRVGTMAHILSHLDVHGGPSLGRPSPSSIHIVALEMDRVISKEQESDVAQKNPPNVCGSECNKATAKKVRSTDSADCIVWKFFLSWNWVGIGFGMNLPLLACLLCLLTCFCAHSHLRYWISQEEPDGDLDTYNANKVLACIARRVKIS